MVFYKLIIFKFYFFNLIKIAIASKTKRTPITINKIFKISDKPSSESDEELTLLTLVESVLEVLVEEVFLEVFWLVFDDVFALFDVPLLDTSLVVEEFEVELPDIFNE